MGWGTLATLCPRRCLTPQCLALLPAGLPLLSHTSWVLRYEVSRRGVEENQEGDSKKGAHPLTPMFLWASM